MAAALVQVPVDYALERLADAGFVGGWSLGSMGLQPVAPGVLAGKSLFDGSDAYVEIIGRPEVGLIDYAVGSPEARVPRIFIRVSPGSDLGYDVDTCLVTLNTARSATATDAQWARTCTTHETEILLIKAQLETAYGRAGS